MLVRYRAWNGCRVLRIEHGGIFMCWALAYHENPVETGEGQDVYRTINDFELISKTLLIGNDGGEFYYNIEQLNIKDEAYYHICNGACSCDFFHQGFYGVKLREDFGYFLGSRLEPCLEQMILIKWLEGDEVLNTLPENIVDVNISGILSVLKNPNPEGLYRIRCESR
jgi:hypothetical protein